MKKEKWGEIAAFGAIWVAVIGLGVGTFVYARGNANRSLTDAKVVREIQAQIGFSAAPSIQDIADTADTDLSTVTPGGAMAKAGAKEGDTLVEPRLYGVVLGSQGQTVPVALRRKGQIVTVSLAVPTLTLTATPSETLRAH